MENLFFLNIATAEGFSKHTQPVLIGNKRYKFIYQNNFREESIYLSITDMSDSEEKTVLKNVLLTPGINLTKFADKTIWNNDLYLADTLNQNRKPFLSLPDDFVFVVVMDW